MSVKERLKTFIKYKKISERDFANTINVSSGYVSAISKSIQPDKLKRISMQYPDINTNWLITGEGEMLKKETQCESQAIGDTNFSMVPLISLDVVGGSNNDVVDASGYTMGYIPFVEGIEGDFAVTVTGKSMYPTYPSGAVVLLRRIAWTEYIEYGEVYVIDLIDGRRLLKEVRKCHSDRSKIVLHSHNPDFDENEISLANVRNMYLVKAMYQKTTM